jgi:hypothetical protein
MLKILPSVNGSAFTHCLFWFTRTYAQLLLNLIYNDVSREGHTSLLRT